MSSIHQFSLTNLLKKVYNEAKEIKENPRNLRSLASKAGRLAKFGLWELPVYGAIYDRIEKPLYDISKAGMEALSYGPIGSTGFKRAWEFNINRALLENQRERESKLVDFMKEHPELGKTLGRAASSAQEMKKKFKETPPPPAKSLRGPKGVGTLY